MEGAGSVGVVWRSVISLVRGRKKSWGLSVCFLWCKSVPVGVYHGIALE